MQSDGGCQSVVAVPTRGRLFDESADVLNPSKASALRVMDVSQDEDGRLLSVDLKKEEALSCRTMMRFITIRPV